MKLTGKIALVTNVSEFMGPAITEEFAREGATLALHDRDERAAKRIGAIATAVGRDTLILTGDLTRSAEADRVVETTVARFGRLDILVNNSANPPTGCPTERITDAQWRDMTGRLLDEPFYCLRAALRVMRPAKRGKKVARDGIQVNAIAQNYVENPTYFPPALTGDPEKLARMVKNIPAGRLARSEESARLAVYLASEDADFFIGQVVPFAGGWVTP